MWSIRYPRSMSSPILCIYFSELSGFMFMDRNSMCTCQPLFICVKPVISDFCLMKPPIPWAISRSRSLTSAFPISTECDSAHPLIVPTILRVWHSRGLLFQASCELERCLHSKMIFNAKNGQLWTENITQCSISFMTYRNGLHKNNSLETFRFRDFGTYGLKW